MTDVITKEEIDDFVKSNSDAPFIAYVQVGANRYFITTNRNDLCLGFEDVTILKDKGNYGKSNDRKN